MRKSWLLLAAPVLAILHTIPAMAATDISVVALPNPVGIPEIIFVIALCGFALWKKDWLRVLLSICIIIWGAFTMSYDIKIAAPLIAIGTVLFIMGILTFLKKSRGGG